MRIDWTKETPASLDVTLHVAEPSPYSRHDYSKVTGIDGLLAMKAPKIQPSNSATETSTQTEASNPEKFAMKAADIATSNSVNDPMP